MKIVHVAQFLGVGGLEKIIFHLAKEQMTQGHDVEVYIYDHEQSWVSFFRSHDIKVTTSYLKKSGYDFQLLMQLSKDLRHADIIHTHDLNPLMYLGPLSLIKKIFRRKDYKLIHTTHGIDHLNTSKKIRYYEKLFTLMTDMVVAVSEKIGNFYKEDLKHPGHKIRVVPNGIKTFDQVINSELKKEKKDWLCKKHDLDFSRPIVLSLSRIVPLKDQKFLISCFKKRPDYQLIIAGPPGDEAYFNELKKEEENYDNIKLIGAQEMVSDYNLGSDLYVSASTSEGIPVAVLEAMAVETPCLVSDIPGHQTLNHHGAFVNLFQLGDLSGFLDKCDFLLTNREAAEEGASKSRTTVEECFSVKNMVQSYFVIYQA